ncbi:MAG TPA: ATP-binding protein [Polyangiaceae bacterium]
MSGQVLAGVVGAWAVCHAALGIYFLMAYALGRRDRELLLFSLLCFALSVASLGISIDFFSTNQEEYARADKIVHAGYIVAGVFNVHFALEFARIGGTRRVAVVLYALAAFFEFANLKGWLWSGFRPVDAVLFGGQVHFGAGVPSPLGSAFYVIGLLESLAAVLLLLVAYRSGRRESLSALIGAGLSLPAIANDLGIAMGFLDHAVSLLPHGFLVYAFGVASALLLRYRIATGELEHAASSLRERTEELRHSHAELRQIQDELSNKKQLAVVGELAAAIAHEVRNPLAVIVNAVAGLRRSSLRPQDRTTLLDIVDEEAARLNRLVGDLLRFARPFSVNRQPVSLSELATRCKAALPDQYEMQVESDDSPESETVWVDPSLMRLVLDNLVSNACQAMREGGTIRVRIRREERAVEPTVRLEIEDNGQGMTPDIRRRALDPFYTTRPAGTGLGLPIVQRIIEAHGGWLGIESAEGVGTIVTLGVPVARATGEAGQASARNFA